ncbi:MAG: hypothetical protein ACYC9Y_02355 [Candidatus Methylomirabilia bacterium]
MVPGFNTDFKYRGETYHVQTEDNGLGNPVVVSLLYHKGAILASRRTPYQDLVGKPGFEQELMVLMKSQHKDLMRALLAGAYDKNGTAPAAAGGSGKHPAAAAAAVAAETAKAATKPLPDPAPLSPPRPAPAAPGAALQTAGPDTATPTLDEAISRYLEEFAATAGATFH